MNEADRHLAAVKALNMRHHGSDTPAAAHHWVHQDALVFLLEEATRQVPFTLDVARTSAVVAQAQDHASLDGRGVWADLSVAVQDEYLRQAMNIPLFHAEDDGRLVRRMAGLTEYGVIAGGVFLPEAPQPAPPRQTIISDHKKLSQFEESLQHAQGEARAVEWFASVVAEIARNGGDSVEAVREANALHALPEVLA